MHSITNFFIASCMCICTHLAQAAERPERVDQQPLPGDLVTLAIGSEESPGPLASFFMEHLDIQSLVNTQQVCRQWHRTLSLNPSTQQRSTKAQEEKVDEAISINFSGQNTTHDFADFQRRLFDHITQEAQEHRGSWIKLLLINNDLGNHPNLPQFIQQLHTHIRGLRSEVVGLRLDYNAIKEISRETLLPLTFLRSLSLNFNQLTTIESDVFQHMPFLRNLMLSDNRLTKLTADAMLVIPRLRYLSLWHNQLQPAMISELRDALSNLTINT